MLKQLYIRNFALIDELDIEFHPGFSVITGETGAGKSIILGAIGLLLGNRADSKFMKAGTDKCVIEAHFNLQHNHCKDFFTTNDLDYDEGDCIVRREISASGKSRGFINDSPVPLSLMKELGEKLVDIHSQHQNLLLRQEDFQLQVIDTMAGNLAERSAYDQAFTAWSEAKKALQKLQQSLSESQQNEDFLRFQQKELTEARLAAGEQEELEQQSELMSHAEDIKSALYEADTLLTSDGVGIVARLRTLTSQLRSVGNVFPTASSLADRTESTYIELKDIAAEIATQVDDIDFDPRQLDEVNQRLDLIYTLQKKYHVDSVEALLEQLDHIDEQLSQIDNSDEELRRLEQHIATLQEKAQACAHQLSGTRRQAAKSIEAEMRNSLMLLGMPNVRFEVSLSSKPLSADGSDNVAFLFSANKSMPLRPISDIASGGEIARVMLSLKVLMSSKEKLPTIIFDEIDTGVSGRVAEQMAVMMQAMSKAGCQVISITHLPQIAAMGTTHYKVTKEETATGTQSRMAPLAANERILEVAQMLSGSNVTAAAIDNAKALLKAR